MRLQLESKCIQTLFASLLRPRRRKHRAAVSEKSLEMGGGVSVELPYGWRKLAEDQNSGLGGCKVEIC